MLQTGAAELLQCLCMLASLVLADNATSPPDMLKATARVLHDNALLVSVPIQKCGAYIALFASVTDAETCCRRLS